jgi:uncharacterized membrane protein YhaH (DUF805 family)
MSKDQRKPSIIGRIRGTAYWSMIGLLLAAHVALAMLLAPAGTSLLIAKYIDMAICFGLTLAVVARFHDFGHSTYVAVAWILASFLLPSVALVSFFGPVSPWPLLNTFGHIPGGLPPYVGSAGYAAAFLLSVVAGLIKGESGPNDFGEEPRAGSPAAVASPPKVNGIFRYRPCAAAAPGFTR